MEMQALNLEIKNLLEIVNKKTDKKSAQEEIKYTLSILEAYYTRKLNDGIARELLNNYKILVSKLSIDIQELNSKNFAFNFPLIHEMIVYLDKFIEK
jgi:hypothetical protein